MKENQRNRSGNEQRNTEQDPMRNQQNDSTREVGQNRESDNLRDADLGSGRSYDYGTQGSEQTENTSGTSGNRSSSRETMHGTADMKDEQVPGRGREMRRESGSGSGLAPKMGTTGSDFDGQNSI